MNSKPEIRVQQLLIIMVKIFCGVKLQIEKFCQRFGSFLLQNTEDQKLQHILRVLLTGREQSRIENNFSVTEYFYDNQLQFRVSQIQTVEIKQKFEALRSIFENTFNIQLIIKKERYLYFYIGEEIILDVSKDLSRIKVNPDTKIKLTNLLGNSDVNVYVII